MGPLPPGTSSGYISTQVEEPVVLPMRPETNTSAPCCYLPKHHKPSASAEEKNHACHRTGPLRRLREAGRTVDLLELPVDDPHILGTRVRRQVENAAGLGQNAS
jgi:hypothetical protein